MRLLASVVIPVYQDEEGLISTLKSLQHQTTAPNTFEVIVSNDGGSSTIEAICQEYQVTCINITPNQGSYNARNQAIHQSNSDILAFVDADIIVPKEWIQTGLAAMEEAEYVAGPVQIIKKDDISLPELYEYYTAFSSQRYISEFKFGVTGNLFVKRQVFDSVGLFNSQLRSGGDFEFGNRVHQRGIFKQVYDESLLVYHPPRGHKNYMKKIKRVSEGVVALAALNTVDHSKIQPSISKSIGKILLPPHPLKTKLYRKRAKPFLPLYLYHWYTNMFRGYYTLKSMIQNSYFKL